jgi:hypothetical protein
MFFESNCTFALAATKLLSVAALLVVIPFDPSYGQDRGAVDERLLACSDIEDTADRAACFDEVVNNMRQDSQAPAQAAEPPTAETDAGLAETAVPAAIITGEEATSDTPAMQIEEQAPVAEEEEEFIEFTASIVVSRKSGLYHFVVELDNGQIWEETDGSRRPSLPKVGQNVRVYEGRFGGYRMKIGNDNRISWVRRLK